MRTITLENVGEVFYRLYESEINFRFENFWDGGYTWSLVGYDGNPEPGEIAGAESKSIILLTT